MILCLQYGEHKLITRWGFGYTLAERMLVTLCSGKTTLGLKWQLEKDCLRMEQQHTPNELIGSFRYDSFTRAPADHHDFSSLVVGG